MRAIEVDFTRKQIASSINKLSAMGYSRGVRNKRAKDGVTLYNIRTDPKTHRNEPCSCGSGKKYKYCCMGQ